VENRFRHEIEWYEYLFCETAEDGCKVGICHKQLHPTTIHFYSKERLEQLVQYHKWNPFLQPIYIEALKHFPKGDNYVR
jgi:hypothetical protein